MTGGAAVRVQGKEHRGKNAVLGGTGTDCLGVGDMFSQLHMLLPVRQEVSDPPAGGVRHTQLGELLLKQSRDDGVKGRAEIHTQNPGVGSCGVQVLEDVMDGQVDCIVYRPVGSVGKLQGVQEGVDDVFQV